MPRKKVSHSTYAVSLYFDGESASKILRCVKSTAEASENFYLTEHNVPSHMTLGIFHSSDDELEKLKRLFKEFASKMGRTFNIDFAGAGCFLEKVIFLRISEESRAYLAGLNSILHEFMLSDFDAGDNRNYLPQNWMPHVALAVKLNSAQFESGMNFLKSHDELLPTVVKVVSVGLARCKPYEEILRVSLCSGCGSL